MGNNAKDKDEAIMGIKGHEGYRWSFNCGMQDKDWAVLGVKGNMPDKEGAVMKNIDKLW